MLVVDVRRTSGVQPTFEPAEIIGREIRSYLDIPVGSHDTDPLA